MLRLLELISNTAKGKLQETIREDGGIVPILWDHQPGKCGWKLKLDPVDEGRDPSKDAITYELELAQVGQGSAYEIVKDTLGNWWKCDQGMETSPYWIFQRDALRVPIFD